MNDKKKGKSLKYNKLLSLGRISINWPFGLNQKPKIATGYYKTLL